MIALRVGFLGDSYRKRLFTRRYQHFFRNPKLAGGLLAHSSFRWLPFSVPSKSNQNQWKEKMRFALLAFALLSHFFRTDVASHCWHSHIWHSHSCLIRTVDPFALLAFALLASHWCRSHFCLSHSCRTSLWQVLSYNTCHKSSGLQQSVSRSTWGQTESKVIFRSLLWQVFDSFSRNLVKFKRRWHTGSRQITEVKHRRAGLVPGWMTTREHPVL